MMMHTIKDLSDELAAAFGMSERAIICASNDLARAGMIGQLDEPATIEDATRLLIAAVGDFNGKAPWCTVRRFWHLPLAAVRTITEETNLIAHRTLPEDDQLVIAARAVKGDSFGTALNNALGDFTFISNNSYTPGKIALSGSPGRTTASLSFQFSEGVVMMCFSDSTTSGSGPIPHGLPLAAPFRTVEIPAAIFEVLRDALEGSPHSWINQEMDDPDVYSRRPLELEGI